MFVCRVRDLTAVLLSVLISLVTVSCSWALSPPNLLSDIPWTDSGGSGYNANFGGVADIVAAFNHARREEESQLGLTANTLNDLVLPSQSAWDSMSDDDKALYLLNDERIARAGMLAGVIGLPFAGIEQNIDSISAYYAQYLHDNDATGHNADGSGGPFARIDNDAEIGSLKNCHEFLPRAENLAYFATTGTTIPLPIERSIYNWVYADASSSWGHRETVLLQDLALNAQPGFKNNNGSNSHAGYLGFHHITSANYQPFPSFASNTGSVVVMNYFDPVSDANAALRGCNYLAGSPVGGTSGPGEVLKRGEMAKAILQAKNISAPAVATGLEYADIQVSTLNAAWIEQFKTEGFTTGCAFNRFCPDMAVTREQMAIIFLKAKFGSAYSPTPSQNVFGDAPLGSFNQAWITTLRDLGFTQGCDTNRFCPKTPVSKAWFDYLLTQLAL